MNHITHNSEEIFIKKINNFKKINDRRYNNNNIPPLYTTHHKTNSTNTYISLSPTIINLNYSDKKNHRTIETNKSTNIKKEKIMNKTYTSKNKKKIKEKDIQIFFFLKSTHHTEIKPRNKYKYLNIKDIKKRFTGSKIESLITIENRIKRKIDKSILKHHLTEIENSNDKNYYSDREKQETIENILNKKQFKYNKDNYLLEKIQPHYSKRSQIGSFSPFSCTPNIMKDNSLMVRLFKQNLNYQKSCIRDKFNDKNGLLDFF